MLQEVGLLDLPVDPDLQVGDSLLYFIQGYCVTQIEGAAATVCKNYDMELCNMAALKATQTISISSCFLPFISTYYIQQLC